MSKTVKTYLLSGAAAVASLLGTGQKAEAQSGSNELTGGFFAERFSVPKYQFNDTFLNTWARVKFNADPDEDNIRFYISTDARFKFWPYKYGYSNPYGFAAYTGAQKYMVGWQVGAGLEGQVHAGPAAIRPYVEANYPVYSGTYGMGAKVGVRAEFNLGKKDIYDTSGSFKAIADAMLGAERTYGPGPTFEKETVPTTSLKLGVAYTF